MEILLIIDEVPCEETIVHCIIYLYIYHFNDCLYLSLSLETQYPEYRRHWTKCASLQSLSERGGKYHTYKITNGSTET